MQTLCLHGGYGRRMESTLMNVMCSRCKKRVAVIFLTRLENGQSVNEGLCLQCAKEMGIGPINDLIEKMGLTDDQLEAMSQQMNDMMGASGEDGDFEPGGATSFPFLQNFFGGAMTPAEQPEGGDAPLTVQPPKQGDSGPGKSGRGGEKRPKFKFLDNYCDNLTVKAAEGRMDTVVGRDREIYRVMQILNRRTKNNPCLIGEPGVGKTAIAEAVAQRLASGDVPPRLKEKELFMLDLTALVAGTQFRGQFESRVKGLVEDVKKHGNAILFIDEIHNLVGAGDAEGSMNAANILKPALSRGELQVIGATTFNEYRKHIEKDAALERRFQPVTVNEPSIADAMEVILGVKKYYEDFHRVKVSDELARKAVTLSERYINDRFLPDKAIDLLDEACSCATLRNQYLAEYDQLNRQLRELRTKVEDTEQSGLEINYEQLAKDKAQLLQVSTRLKEVEPLALGVQVTEEDMAKVIELWTGIPASKIQENEMKKVAQLEEALKAHIVGQDEAVSLVAKAIRRSRVNISSRDRPASFIFVGPTGVGKTELVKVLSRELFDDADPLIRLDMSEFMEKFSVSRIIGSPPGYVGYDEAGQLTEKVRRRPYSVVLFDEIEKAHPDVMNILLQILDEGKITDAQGRSVSFANTVIVMTSNAGSEQAVATLGFGRDNREKARDSAMKSLRQFLRPEFLGRVDEIVVFRDLDEKDFAQIAALMLEELKAPLQERGIAFQYDQKALDAIAKEAHGHRSGARDIRRIVRREVEDVICLRLVEQGEGSVKGVQVTADEEGKLILMTV